MKHSPIGRFWTAGLLGLWIGTASAPAAQDLRFHPTSEPSIYDFDTGILAGRLRANGRNQGMVELRHKPSGQAVARGGGLPGLFSYYRVFSSGTRYDAAMRDWPTVNRLLPDGGLELTWPPAPDHPIKLQAVFRWRGADTLDVETLATPQGPMPRFEVFLSSYFQPAFRARVYVKPNFHAARGKPGFIDADVNPLVEGTYLMFPRDREACLTIFDGRWDKPPHPVQWSVTRLLAAPLAMRQDPQSGLTALFMAPDTDCFGIATPYNQTPPDGVAGHYSLYLSLFGQDVPPGRTVRAHTRLVVKAGLTDAQAVALYEQYRASLARPQEPPAPRH